MQGFEHLVRKKDGQPLQYLVVDDSVFARKNLQRILALFGGQVLGEAGDGRAAIDAYAKLQPDLVLMDVTMPDMEGIEAAAEISSRYPNARIVMVAYQENVSEALRSGALFFVQKPPKPELLYDVIKKVLGDEVTTTPSDKGEPRGHAN